MGSALLGILDLFGHKSYQSLINNLLVYQQISCFVKKKLISFLMQSSELF